MKLHKLPHPHHKAAITFPSFEQTHPSPQPESPTTEKQGVLKSVKRGVKKRLRRISSGFGRRRTESLDVTPASEPNIDPSSPIHILAVSSDTSSSDSRDSTVMSNHQEQIPRSEPELEDVDDASDEDGGPVMSPPSVYVEPEVPQPFLIDEEEAEPSSAPPRQHIETPHETRLPFSPVSPSALSQTLPSPNVNKAVPPPPSDSDVEEDAPEVYLPDLVMPTMFLPIPNVRRPLSFYLMWWFSKDLLYFSSPLFRNRLIN